MIDEVRTRSQNSSFFQVEQTISPPPQLSTNNFVVIKLCKSFCWNRRHFSNNSSPHHSQSRRSHSFYQNSW